MIKRQIEEEIRKHFFKKKAIILLGPRQTGKTTLIKNILGHYFSESLLLDGDDPTIQLLLERPNTQQIKQLIGKNKFVFIDEAQRIKDIGITSKIIVDQFPDVQIIISGSSSFEISEYVQEPLTGRKWTYNLWPISWSEYQDYANFLISEQDLENRLVFGMYPDVLNHKDEQEKVLRELTESYLFKDVLIYANLKKSNEIHKLLQALSFQIGNEVSYRELGEITGLDPKTVERYIDILEKAFVIFRLTPFSRNLRNEIKASRKIYFYDNGIRNAVIGQYQALALRQDIGPLWENFLMSERLKYNSYNNINAQKFFWRTNQQQEIDYIEVINGNIQAFEFKWNEKRKVLFSKTFTNNYNSTNKTIHRNNFREFICLP